MKRLLLLLALLWASPALAQGQGSPININCSNVFTFSGVAVNTVAITAPAGKLINFCGWHVTNTATAGTFALTMGTGAVCGTNTFNITPVLNVTSSAPSADHEQSAFVSSPAQASSLCYNPSVTTISGVLYYNIN
jgi:hypothetical protein